MFDCFTCILIGPTKKDPLILCGLLNHNYSKSCNFKGFGDVLLRFSYGFSLLYLIFVFRFCPLVTQKNLIVKRQAISSDGLPLVFFL